MIVAPCYYVCSTKQKGGKHIGIKKGTKLTENPKDFLLRTRLDAETLKQLDECVNELYSNRSEIVRSGIKVIHRKIKQNAKE